MSNEAVSKTVTELTTEKGEVTLPSGVTVQVYVCKTKHLPVLLRLLATVFEPLNIKLSQKPKPGEISALLDDASVILNILAAGLPLIVEAARTLTTLTTEEVENLDIDDLAALVDAIIRRNYDFFTMRLLPALAKYLPEQFGNVAATTVASTTGS